MNILVTGASGLLGSACVRHLRARNHLVVTTDQSGAIEHRVDLADAHATASLPLVDAVIHCAAVQYVTPDLPLFGRDAWFERNNVVATRNLVNRYAGTGAHFVNIGSSMMYAQDGRARYDVASPWRAQGPYTRSKIEAQRLVDAMPQPTACVLPCIIAGEGRGGLFASLAGAMRRWRTAVLPGPSQHKIHLVHVRDAASLVTTVVERRATGRFNAASPEPLSIGEWIDEMASAMGVSNLRRLRIPLGPLTTAVALSGYRLLAREQMIMLQLPHVLDVGESLALGWTPQYTNAEIVRETATAQAAGSR
jgi:nucleoside-diphosphate-sugar epimerase